MIQPPDRRFDNRQQKEAYFKWMIEHPQGFVLNWPRAGKNADGNLAFHRAGCPDLVRQSFPTEDYHKVCMRRLSDLTVWAEQNRRFPDSPAHHACAKCFPGGINEFKKAFIEEPLVAIDQEPPAQVETTVLRFIRDTALACRIKELHDWKCQLCKYRIELYDGRFYAEAHHIRPLGGGHKGLDTEGNIVCLCPTCHAKLDYGVIPLRMEELTLLPGHQVAPESIAYHNQSVYRAPLN